MGDAPLVSPHRARAKRLFLAAWRAQPEDGRSACLLGNMLSQEGNPQGAEVWLARAWNSKQEHLPFAVAYADLAAARADWAAAAERYRFALSIAPDDPFLGRRLRFAEAAVSADLEKLREAAQKDPADREAARQVGLFYQKIGDWSQARAVFERLFEADARDLSAANSLATVSLLEAEALRGKDPAAAEPLFSRAQEVIGRSVAMNPKDPFAHAFHGDVARRRGRWEEAEAAYREAVRLKADTPGWWVSLGEVLNRQGRSTEAADCWRQALRLDPGNVEARNALERTER